MADRGLTAREFWRLSPTERMKRCGELSDHEAFVARLTDPTHLSALLAIVVNIIWGMQNVKRTRMVCLLSTSMQLLQTRQLSVGTGFDLHKGMSHDKNHP